MVENTIKIIQCLSFFSNLLCLLFSTGINKTSSLRELIEQLNKETN